MVRLYLSAWLLTVNMKLLFSKHGSAKGNLCAFAFVQRGDTEQSEGWERCWEGRQTTHHLITLECATTLCIFSVALVIGVVIVQTVRTERAWQEGRLGRQFDEEKKNNSYLGFWDLSNCRLIWPKYDHKSQIFAAAAACAMCWEIWSNNIWNHLKVEPVGGWPLCILALDSNVSFWLNPTVDSPATFWVCYFCSF